MIAILLHRRLFMRVLLIIAVIFVITIGLVMTTFNSLQSWVIVSLVGAAMAIAVLMYSVIVVHTELQKRISELSTLGRVSKVMQASLDLEYLLPVIQDQIMQVIGVDNFYVALLDKQRNQLWYPLAVKRGARQYWPERPVTDRLTDRVIRDAKTIMLTPQIQKGPNPIGVPKGEEMPKSWLGVPLISPQGCIGCLAIFTVTEGIEFSSFDQDLLSTLSSPVCIAIENALLYKQSKFRANQLETLNTLTSQITASLELDEVVAQVTRAIAEVSGDQRSALYLYSPGEDTVKLAHVHGLSDAFVEENREFSIASGRRTRCLRSAKAELTPNIVETSHSMKFLKSIRVDDVQAMVDLPLITPEGQIGFLSVFYSEPHEFTQDEIDLLQTFAAQAALAVGNAQLHATTDAELTRRVYQLAILESVGRELNAATHSDRLFKLILDYAIEFTQAPYGMIAQFDADNDLAIFKATHGYDIPEILVMETGITLRALNTGKVQNVGDVHQDPDYLDVTENQTLSQLSVPIIRENEVFGMITLESDRLNGFSENEQALVEQLSNQAAIALLNADLYLETQKHLREQSTLYQVTARFAGSQDVDSIIENLYLALMDATTPDHMGIYIWDALKNSYILHHIGTNHEIGYLPEYLVEKSGGEQPFSELSPEEIGEDSIRDTFPALQEKSVVTAVYPMRSAINILGIVVICKGTNLEIGPDTHWICEAIISQGAIAIQSAQLFFETTQRREQLAAVINSVSDGILMFDHHGHISLANQPLINLGKLSRSQVIGTKLDALEPNMLQRLGFSEQELKVFLDQLPKLDAPHFPKSIYDIEDQHGDNLYERTMERTVYPVLGAGDISSGWMIVWRPGVPH